MPELYHVEDAFLSASVLLHSIHGILTFHRTISEPYTFLRIYVDKRLVFAKNFLAEKAIPRIQCICFPIGLVQAMEA